MDAIPVPKRKKLNFVRASAEQLSVLKDDFAASSIPSKESLAELSEKTGLTAKWITSWFMRERKKLKKSKLSREEIAAFKQEHSDSPTPFTDDALETKRQNSNPQDAKIKNQCKSKSDSGPEGSLGSVITASSRSQPLSQIQLPTSTFILRPMVPVMYQPQNTCSNLVLPSRSDSVGAATSPHQFSDVSVVVPPSNSRLAPAFTSPPGFFVSSYDIDDHLGSHAEKTQYQHGGSTDTAPQDSQFCQAYALAKNTPNKTRQDHCGARRPLQPLITGDHLSQHPKSLSTARSLCGYNQTMQDRKDKENLVPCNQPHVLHSRPVSAESPKLSDTRPNQAYQTIHVPQRSQNPDHLRFDVNPQEASSQFQQLPHRLWYGDAYSQQLPYSALLNPMLAPLKHLSTLAPFNLNDLSHETIIRCVLDERLAQEDPFQAAMGLVAASRLGLEWNPK